MPLLTHATAKSLFVAFCVSLAHAQYVQQGSPISFVYGGVAVSADGNTVLVGNASDNSSVGGLSVFTRSNGVWSQQGPELIGTGSVTSQGAVGQGLAVAISADGNTALVGGPLDGGNARGAVWVFVRSNGQWTQQGNKLVGSGTGANALFGDALALSADGNTAIIGNANVIDGAYIFTRTNGLWTQQGGKLTGNTIGCYDAVSLSADGSTAAVGNYCDGTVGATLIYVRSNGNWNLQARLVGTGSIGDAFQGEAVSLSSDGNTVLVGGSFDSNNAGAAWIFTRAGNQWSQVGGKLTASDPVGAASGFGRYAALSGDGTTALIVGPADNNSTGATWVFSKSTGTWTQQSKIVNGLAGEAVAISYDGITAVLSALEAFVYVRSHFISMVHQGNLTQGQNPAYYTIKTGSQLPVFGAITASATLPPGLAATAITGPGWNCDIGSISCSRSDSAPATGIYPPITLAVSVSPNAPPQETTQVTLSGGGQSTITNSDTANVLTPFNDVNSADAFLPAINLLRQSGITTGCQSSPPMYCSADTIPENQMAVFVIRSVFGSDNFFYTANPYFVDVPSLNLYFPWVQKMQDLGIALPCQSNLYCPDSAVTRGIMSVLIIRSRFGTSTPTNYPSTPYFTDVPATHPYFPWIQKMKQLGITSGCSPTTYCPDDPVTRGQMAVFIMRGEFNQLLPAGSPVLLYASAPGLSTGVTSAVTLIGQNTNFQSGVTQVNAGPGITVTNVQVANATTVTAQFTILNGATLGPRTITVTTGSEEATLPNVFRVQ